MSSRQQKMPRIKLRREDRKLLGEDRLEKLEDLIQAINNNYVYNSVIRGALVVAKKSPEAFDEYINHMYKKPKFNNLKHMHIRFAEEYIGELSDAVRKIAKQSPKKLPYFLKRMNGIEYESVLETPSVDDIVCFLRSEDLIQGIILADMCDIELTELVYDLHPRDEVYKHIHLPSFVAKIAREQNMNTNFELGVA